MLTNLDFLTPGCPWPPPSEKDRLMRYAYNKKLFDGEHAKVYREQMKRIEREIGSMQDIIGYVVVPNYQRLISLKTADLLCGEPPEFTIGDGEKNQKLNDRLAVHGLHGLLYQCGIDLSRYGDALLSVSRDKSGKAVLSVGQPSTWFPVVSPSNVKLVLYHVVAWEESIKTASCSDTRERGLLVHGIYPWTIPIRPCRRSGGTYQNRSSGICGLPYAGLDYIRYRVRL